MHWAAIHYVWGYSLEELVAIGTIVGFVIISIRWINGKAKKTAKNIKDDMLDPIRRELKLLNKNIERSNKQYEEATRRLEKGDRKFIHHDEQLQDHERRITYLEEEHRK